MECNGIEHKPLQVWTGDYVYIQFGAIRDDPPFSDESKRLEMLQRLNQIPGVAVPESAVDKYPGTN